MNAARWVAGLAGAIATALLDWWREPDVGSIHRCTPDHWCD